MRSDDAIQIARKGRRAGKHFVGGNTQCVLIGRPAERILSDELLRTHISRRSDRHARLRESFGINRFRNTEIRNHHFTLCADEDVSGFDITVNDAFRVCVRERARRLPENPLRLVNRDLQLFLGQAAADFVQRPAFDQAHHEENELPVVLDLVYDNDVVVLQLRRNARFLQKPLGHTRREIQPRLHDLDGHAASKPQVGGDVHHGHAATSDFTSNVVQTDRRGAQAIQQRIARVLTVGEEVCHDGARSMCATVWSG